MFQNRKLYWIGIRESEIVNTDQLFDGSITIFGNNVGNNYSFEREHHIRIDYNKDNRELSDFINKTAGKILQEFPDCNFLLYYPMEAIEYDSSIYEHIICLNPTAITDLLENKIYTKLWLSRLIPVIPFSTMIGAELSYSNLCAAFTDESGFVIQGSFSCGGSDTWLVSNEEDMKKVLSDIALHDVYTVTPYKKESISVNIHLVIYENQILLFPASVQIISERKNHLCYSGADFVIVDQLPQEITDKIQSYGELIGKCLQAAGYRGICGIDFLTTRNEVFLMEVNARFQSSSFLINSALKRMSLPSLQELHIDAFYNNTSSYTIPKLTVSQSFYSYSFHANMKEQIRYIYDLAEKCPEVDCCIDDELDWNMPMENNTYLFKLVFHVNITCIAPEYACRLYNGFDYDFKLLEGIPWHEQLKRFKVLILNQGVRIKENALKQLLKYGGPNYEIFYALDICVENKLFLNVPYQVAFSELSPFEIGFTKDEYWLTYYRQPLARVSVRTIDLLAQNFTPNNIPYCEISYLGVDRLRIHQRSGCFFKNHGMGCRFCDIEPSESSFCFDDIKEVIKAYSDHKAIRHYLVGGGSQDPSDTFEEMLEIIRYIHDLTAKNIYLMSIPPKETQLLNQLKAAGVTEVAFNIEVFDRKLAAKYMPGKGILPIERYEKAFREATTLWGKTGNVRSALIIGLEPMASVLDGIEYLCKLGVSPILSLMKPADQMDNFWAPNSQEVLAVWEQAEVICQKYAIPLGPTCHCCEDNVLKATLADNGI